MVLGEVYMIAVPEYDDKEVGLIPENSTIDISELSWNKFVSDLLETYNERFN